MNEDEQMKALFTTVGEQQGPPLGFTAAGVVRRGRRIRVARWGAGVGAGLVVAAAVTVSVALAGNRDVEPATPPVVDTTTEETVTETPTDFPTTTTTTTGPTTTDEFATTT